MKLTILCVGKIKEKYFTDAIAEYMKRLGRYAKMQIIELPDEKTPESASEKEEEQILKKEGERLQSHIPEDAYVIALAIEGKKYDSPAFSERIEKIMSGGKSHICFVIGGSLGMDADVKRKADELISFSDMTFPHQLMRVITLEQVYRAFRIMNHEPYHK